MIYFPSLTIDVNVKVWRLKKGRWSVEGKEAKFSSCNYSADLFSWS